MSALRIGYVVASWDHAKGEQRVDSFSGFGGDIYQTLAEAEDILGLTRATMHIHQPHMHYEVAELRLLVPLSAAVPESSE